MTGVRARNPQAVDLLDEWDESLGRPVEEIVTAMLVPGHRVRDLRKLTPFADVLEPHERTRVYREFVRRATAA